MNYTLYTYIKTHTCVRTHSHIDTFITYPVQTHRMHNGLARDVIPKIFMILLYNSTSLINQLPNNS